MTLVLLCAFAFLAGLIDSVAGGGGLIQLPALLILLPELPIAMRLGTNKGASVAGTTAAMLTYLRRVRLDWRRLLPTALLAGVGSWGGAHVVSRLDDDVLRPFMLGLLIAVALYTLRQKNFGVAGRTLFGPRLQTLAFLAIGLVIGFYDGFFGPGTGSFLIFAGVKLLGFDLLHASATAKVINVATNIAALAFFIPARQVLWSVALPMAACNMLGGVVGARLALQRGNRFVRVVFLVVLAGVIVRLAYDLARQSV